MATAVASEYSERHEENKVTCASGDVSRGKPSRLLSCKQNPSNILSTFSPHYNSLPPHIQSVNTITPHINNTAYHLPHNQLQWTQSSELASATWYEHRTDSVQGTQPTRSLIPSKATRLVLPRRLTSVSQPFIGLHFIFPSITNVYRNRKARRRIPRNPC